MHADIGNQFNFQQIPKVSSGISVVEAALRGHVNCSYTLWVALDSNYSKMISNNYFFLVYLNAVVVVFSLNFDFDFSQQIEVHNKQSKV